MVLRLKPEKKEEKERIREELLRAALRLSAAHGFASLGLREVSREALIAPTSFYRHFEGMEALGLALIRDKVEPFIQGVIGPRGPSGNDAATWVAALFNGVDREPELTRFLVAERVGAFASLRNALREALDRLATALAERLSGTSIASKRSRALHDAVEVALVLLLDAAAQLLDSPPEARPALRARTLQRLQAQLWDARRIGREA